MAIDTFVEPKAPCRNAGMILRLVAAALTLATLVLVTLQGTGANAATKTIDAPRTAPMDGFGYVYDKLLSAHGATATLRKGRQ